MKFVLYLGAEKQQMWRHDGKRWERWAGEPQGSLWVVTDLPEESFTEIRTPRLMGRDRSAFLARQIATAYPDTPYRSSMTPLQDGGLLGKIAPTRQILYGINAAEHIDAALDAAAVPIAGVWPVSLLLAQLCHRSKLPADLIVALPGPGTLRIVYLHNRAPILARLTSTPNEPEARIEEIAKTLRYLENTQILPRERKSHPVLFLGDIGLLQAERLPANLHFVMPENMAGQTHDWPLPLFDLLVKSLLGSSRRWHAAPITSQRNWRGLQRLPPP